MPRPRQFDPSMLTLRLQTQGPLAAQELAAAAGVDRSQISRAFSGLGDQIVRLGSTRGMRYALRRGVRGFGHSFTLRRIDESGRAQDWAELTALHGGWRIEWADATRVPAWAEQVIELGGWSAGFPFFLSDVRPQGYLGRAVGLALPPMLGLPANPSEWSDDDTLTFLQAEGDDLPGNLIVGDQPLQRVLRRQMDLRVDLIPDTDCMTRYPALAETAMEPGRGGSSVEGEQPKFLATLGTAAGPVPVIVKFTDQLTTPTGRRWADLLSAEAHALTILHEHGETAAAPRVVDAGGRRFLEVTRFDRVGAYGRRGVVSLRALHDALPGADTTDWTERAVAFEQQGLIAPETLRSISLRQRFGRLLGNSDMHFGNLAFWLDDAQPFRLAPAYDVLPMLWAPAPGRAAPLPEFVPPAPLPAEREIWAEAAVWAVEFWRRVAADTAVSAEFREIARRAGAHVERMRGLFA
jgi:hypothetical protein